MIDLRSDTITQPCLEMRQAMAEAPVGDDVYGDDPTVNKLEEYVADLCGFESALYVPSGTMSNQIAINLHCRAGDTILAEEGAHTYAYEAGAAAALSGVQFKFLANDNSSYTRDNLEANFIPANLHSAPVTLIVVENTHNRSGGRVVDLEALKTVHQFAQDKQVATHCDGARIWNAAAALGLSEKQLLSDFQSASVCFSKGLGAPVGSALLGDRAFIERGRKIRKRLGGGMRQAGIIAAGALYALKNNRDSIADDHKAITEIIKALESCPAAKSDRIEFNYPKPITNMVYFRIIGRDGDALNRQLEQSGILANHLGGGWIRLVTHRDISAAQLAEAVAVCSQLKES